MSPRFEDILGPRCDDHYCARCLSPARRKDRACEHCDLPFEGSGRFDRLPGRPPEGSAWVRSILDETRVAAQAA